MEKKITEIKKLKPGGYILIEDIPMKVVSVQTSKPGKHGGAKARLVTKGLFSDQKKIIVKPADTRINVPIIEKRSAQVIAIIGKNVQIMDTEDYSISEVPIPEDIELKEGSERNLNS